MTFPADTEVAVVSVPETTDYVDWPAIIAGVVLASAISIVLLTFGSAIGLSFTNFSARDGASPIWIAIAAASWLLWVQVSSFMAGGYLTGRMRRRVGDATEHEVDVRDGAHGILVWSGALVLGAFLALSGVSSVANAVGSTAATLTEAAANVAEGSADDAGPNAYFADMLFRPAATEQAAPAASTFGGSAAEPAAVPTGEAVRILAQSAADGELSATDRSYLGQLVAANTDLTAEAATARVDEVTAAIKAAKAKAAAAAETARKTGVIAAFLLAASLLASAAGAYWAASMGGRHRDEGTAFPTLFRRY